MNDITMTTPDVIPETSQAMLPESTMMETATATTDQASTDPVASFETNLQNTVNQALTDAQATSGSGFTAGNLQSTTQANPYRALADQPPTEMSAGIVIALVIYTGVILLNLIAQYVLSRKLKIAYPWLGLIPVLNLYNLVKIAGHHGWKIILMVFPIVNIFYMAFSFYPAVSKRTGHGIGTTIALFFLHPIVFPIVAFTHKGEGPTDAMPATSTTTTPSN